MLFNDELDLQCGSSFYQSGSEQNRDVENDEV